MEISLPDEAGRLQILEIHTTKMKENSFLAPDINLAELGMWLGCEYACDVIFSLHVDLCKSTMLQVRMVY